MTLNTKFLEQIEGLDLRDPSQLVSQAPKIMSAISTLEAEECCAAWQSVDLLQKIDVPENRFHLVSKALKDAIIVRMQYLIQKEIHGLWGPNDLVRVFSTTIGKNILRVNSDLHVQITNDLR